jgi:hypothetical protein
MRSKLLPMTCASWRSAENDNPVIEPHRTSMQWTRRFIGLKVFLTLLVAGWRGYQETITNMVRLGDVLRTALRGNGWRIVNRTPVRSSVFKTRPTPKAPRAPT